jgi:hypothetical protein
MAFLSELLTRLRVRNRRRDKRFDVDLPYIILVNDDHPNGVHYRAEDWSVGGFRLTNYRERVKLNDTLIGKIQFPSGPQGTFVAKVSYILSDDSIGAEFIELSPPEFLFPVKA